MKQIEPKLDIILSVSKYTQNLKVTYDDTGYTYDSTASTYDNLTQSEIVIKGGLPKLVG